MTVDGTAERTGKRPGATWWLVAFALVIGLGIGHWGMPDGAARAADPASPEATATRAAELAELDALRTKVAQPEVCTPAATETPTATPSPEPTATQVPAVAAGTAIAYGTDWKITIHSIQTIAAPDGIKVNGQLVKVTLTLENVSNAPHAAPFGEWRLVDAAGNRYKASTTATERAGTHGFGVPIDAHATEDRALVFDIAVDAGTSFVLESTKDPTFRVQLAFEARG